MSALIGIAVFGMLTWLGGVMVDQAWNEWYDSDIFPVAKLIGILGVAGIAWLVVLPLWIAPFIL